MFWRKSKIYTLSSPAWAQIRAVVKCICDKIFHWMLLSSWGKSSHDTHSLRNAAKKLLITRSIQICTCLSCFTWLSKDCCTFLPGLEALGPRNYITIHDQFSILSVWELCVTSDPLPPRSDSARPPHSLSPPLLFSGCFTAMRAWNGETRYQRRPHRNLPEGGTLPVMWYAPDTC